jgi:hypothetical protein
MGLSWIGITSPWWGSSISFIIYLFNEQGLSLQLYLLVTIPFVPIFLVFFLKAITDLILKKYQKIILILVSLQGILFEVFYIYLSFINPEILGTLESTIDVRFKGFVVAYLISVVFILFISGIFFGKFSLKSHNPEVKLQGKFIIAAFISFTIGAFLDSALPLNIITLALSRVILISASLEFYMGFIFPRFLKKRCGENKMGEKN